MEQQIITMDDIRQHPAVKRAVDYRPWGAIEIDLKPEYDKGLRVIAHSTGKAWVNIEREMKEAV